MDRDAGLAIRLARSAGRLDWWNVKQEHTPFQWLLQAAAEIAYPTGDHREDMRAAVMTANLMSMLSAKRDEMNDEKFGEIVRGLMQYLPGEDEIENENDLKALELMRKGE